MVLIMYSLAGVSHCYHYTTTDSMIALDRLSCHLTDRIRHSRTPQLVKRTLSLGFRVWGLGGAVSVYRYGSEHRL